MRTPVNLFRYHDLARRLAVFSTEGGAFLRGDREDLQFVDAEPALADGEHERVRINGLLQLVGSRTVPSDRESPSLGLVLEAVGLLVVTTRRVIVLALRGASSLGRIGAREIHTFVLPWDLVDVIGMPERKSFDRRVAGGRSIAPYSELTGATLFLTSYGKAEINGRPRSVDDHEVLHLLTEHAVDHRLTVSPPEDHTRLQSLRDGLYVRAEGELVAAISRPDSTGKLPVHVVGRLTGSDGSNASRSAALVLLQQL